MDTHPLLHEVSSSCHPSSGAAGLEAEVRRFFVRPFSRERGPARSFDDALLDFVRRAEWSARERPVRSCAG